jgi:hypothetical protein
MGPRHIPLNAAFMNGTVEGEDVWIPMTSILGGQERCGFGWNMFVECLAEGRGVSLPAGSIGAAKSVVAGVGAYARVRKQFRVPIAEFGGIQEGEQGERMMSLLSYTNSSINSSKPFSQLWLVPEVMASLPSPEVTS